MEFSELQRASLDELENYGGRLSWRRLNDPDPYLVYLILRDRLGEPSNQLEDEIDWEWVIRIQNHVVYVYSRQDRLPSLEIYGLDRNQTDAENIANDFISLLKSQTPKYISKLTKPDPNHLSGYVLQNPYAIYFNSANSLLKKARELGGDTKTELANREEIEDLCQSAFFLYVASFEGFMNLLYEIYLKPSLRDDRINARLSREQIDIKLRLAPLYCTCFSNEVIDHRTEEFQQFQFVVDLRNDFIHANFTKQMRIPVVKVDDHLFLPQPQPDGKYGISRDMTLVGIPTIEFVKQSIENMVAIVIKHMNPRFRHEFSEVYLDDQIVVGIVEGEYIIDLS